MIRKWEFFGLAALAGCFLLGHSLVRGNPSSIPVSQHAAHHTPSAQFRVFDGTYFKDKPDLSAYGISPVNLVYEDRLYDRHLPAGSMPPAADIEEVAHSAGTAKAITILDVERWNASPNAAQLYVELVRRLNELSPGLKLGYYSVVPKCDYWRAVEGPGSEKFIEWRQENDKRKAVADSVDYLFPSLYTFYDDPKAWVAYAEANIAEARRIAGGKPVYPFIWPVYHDSNRFLKGKPIPPDFWRLELETVRQFADGVVIWGGGGKWDPHAPWWLETKKFLASLHAEKLN